ncbi:MAG: HlyD family efflux transporter periplasmic adaptor subunit [Myxococcales bacterium]|nr:HlyD family efflux transporter periplasmic adaptor subunit [Myxococcales bacterium]
MTPISNTPTMRSTSSAAALASSAAMTLVKTPRALKVLARLVATFFGLLLAAMVFAPWQQSVSGKGRVVAFAPMERQQEISAPIEGNVTEWFVQEGSVVKKGEPLFKITDNDPAILDRLMDERNAVIARREAAAARAASLTSRQRALESSRSAAVRAASSRVSMSKQRTAAATRAKEAAEESERISRLNVDRQKQLQKQGLASDRTVELAEFEVVRATTEVQRAFATLQAALGEELALEQDQARVMADITASIDDARASEASARGEEANASSELARLDVRLARQSTMDVKAAIDGTVLRLLKGQGNVFVKSGESILTLVPDTEVRAVELWVDGNDMPLISKNRDVRLQFEGWPAVQFTGWPSVAVGTFGGKVSLIDATDDGTGQFRLLIVQDPTDTDGDGKPDAPWPTGLYLRQGVRVNGWVMLDQVRLGFELWRRFNAFPPTVTPGEPQPGAKPKGKDKAKG